MPGLDHMHEQELVTELLRLAAECERLNFEVAQVGQRQRYCDDPQSVLRADQKERARLVEMNRLMARRRAVEGHLMRVKGQLRPLRLE